MGVIMGRHGFGTFDNRTRTFKVRQKGFSAIASIRKLRELFGPAVPDDERGADRYWRQYLEVEREKAIVAKYIPLEERLAAFAFMEKDKLVEQFAQTLKYIGHSKEPVKPEAPAVPMLADEVKAAWERKRAKCTHKGWHHLKQHLEFFLEQAGNVPLTEIDVPHYRAFMAALAAHETWGERSKVNAQRAVHTFLRRMENDHGKLNLRFGFIKNSEYILSEPDGEKKTWAYEEVQTALRHATGAARCALLLGLNCGFYRSDIAALTAEKFDGKFIHAVRKKNEHKKKPFVGSWALWSETVAALQFGLTEAQIDSAFNRLREEHGLPEQSDLRKTTQQWLDENTSEEIARMFRGEKPPGNHGKFYSKFTDAQRDKLAAALDKVRVWLGL
jgi:integrase